MVFKGPQNPVLNMLCKHQEKFEVEVLWAFLRVFEYIIMIFVREIGIFSLTCENTEQHYIFSHLRDGILCYPLLKILNAYISWKICTSMVKK